MSESSIHAILNESFPKSGKEEWIRVASLELGNQNEIENLIWKIGELKFYPYYEEKDLQDLSYLKHYQNPREQGGWENLPMVKVAEESHANEQALESLTMGADGVMFDVVDGIDFNINQLLTEINWSFCRISFLTRPETKIVTKILDYVKQNEYASHELRGSIFWTTLPQGDEVKSLILSSLKNFHALGIIVQPSSPVEEIAKALEQGARLMDSLTDLQIEREMIFKNICLSFTAEENFLINIAKIKAARVLWYQLSQAFEISFLPSDLYIHVVSRKSTSAAFDPHGHMIRNTTDGLSSVLGNCNALTLCSDDHIKWTSRISLHVSNILKEESHLDKVIDPVAGAYAIESMVNSLAEAAWKNFQSKMMS